MLREIRAPNIGIVSSYNDMLSAHQPLARFPGIIKHAARQVGATAQFAGGVTAMCDDVTQGQPGMELSLFSRDVIAMSNAIALSHGVFDAVLCVGASNGARHLQPAVTMVSCEPRRRRSARTAAYACCAATSVAR